MDVFDFRDKLVDEYARFTRSFVRIRAADIKTHVDQEYAAERFWPAPMVQLNPAFVSGGDIGRFVAEGVLHPECERIFRAGKSAAGAPGAALTLHRHQEQAIRIAQRRESYVLTTGTGSGKSLAYFIPIIDDVLRRRAAGGAKGIAAIVVYPMCQRRRETASARRSKNAPVTTARMPPRGHSGVSIGTTQVGILCGWT